jgi:predicted transcriptional regulator
LAKVKLSVTVQEHLAARVQELAAVRSQQLSRIVEAALGQFLDAQLEAEMAEGYRVMASFDRDLAESDMTSGFETLPDA